jgi:excinuclease ABC subunit C
MFLEGRNRDLIESLKKRMEEEAEHLHFEKAARIRDQIRHIERVVEKQSVVSSDFIDRDVIGFYRQDGRAAIYSLFIRAGKLLGGKGFNLSSVSLPDEEILSSFLKQYYREDRFIPEQILIPKPISEKSLTEEWLTEQKGKKVHLLVPQKGDKRRLLGMASENAEKFFHREVNLEKEKGDLLSNLRESLHLGRVPRKIEAFDISNLQGGQAVGSMVTFEDGKPSKDRYRHFRIKTVEGADDYGMMYEVLLRRYQRALEEKDLPDLVLLDGGRGHLNVAKEVFKELGVKEVDLLSLAKERRPGGSRFPVEKSGEKIFHPQYKEPIALGRQSPVLRFLDQIRDEAHRFAISYHKKVRRRETLQSLLEEIPGIGKTRQRELLRYFGSVGKMKEATLEELKKAPKMTSKTARSVYDYFHPEKN